MDNNNAYKNQLNLREHGCAQMIISDPDDQRILNNGFRTAASAMDDLHLHLDLQEEEEENSSRSIVDMNNNVNLKVHVKKKKCNCYYQSLLLGVSNDAHHANGYHPHRAIHDNASSSLSRYNIHREGFVFSDGVILDLNNDDDDSSISNAVVSTSFKEFHRDMKAMRGVLHKLALQAWSLVEKDVLDDIEIEMRKVKHTGTWQKSLIDIDLKSQLVDSNQTDDFEKSSQWHVKRYQYTDLNEQDMNETSGEGSEKLLLGLHTDPSLISIVVHDASGIQDGCRGLQVKISEQNKEKNTQTKWVELPQHGHGVCTILIGGAMARIIPNDKNGFFCGHFQPCPHKVCAFAAASSSHRDNGKSRLFDSSKDVPRVVATYFLRPPSHTILRPIDGVPLLHSGKQKIPRSKRPISFHDWCARTSKNYRKSKLPSCK